MSIPHYHQQPATLDPGVQIPEDTETVPLAQGHTEEKAADVAEAAVEHKDAVLEEERAREQAREAGEPEPGLPGDPTIRRDPETGEAIDSDDEPVPTGTVEEVLAWVGDDHSRAQRALVTEKAGQNRGTLVTKLEAI